METCCQQVFSRAAGGVTACAARRAAPHDGFRAHAPSRILSLPLHHGLGTIDLDSARRAVAVHFAANAEDVQSAVDRGSVSRIAPRTRTRSDPGPDPQRLISRARSSVDTVDSTCSRGLACGWESNIVGKQSRDDIVLCFVCIARWSQLIMFN